MENLCFLHATGLMIMGLGLSWFEVRKRVVLKRWCARARQQSSAMRKPEPLQSLRVRRLVCQSEWVKGKDCRLRTWWIAQEWPKLWAAC